MLEMHGDVGPVCLGEAVRHGRHCGATAPAMGEAPELAIEAGRRLTGEAGKDALLAERRGLGGAALAVVAVAARAFRAIGGGAPPRVGLAGVEVEDRQERTFGEPHLHRIGRDGPVGRDACERRAGVVADGGLFGPIGAKGEGIDGEIERAETDDQDGERAGPERQSAMQFERMHVELTVDARRGRVDREAELAAHLVAVGQAGDRDPGPVAHGEGNLAMAGDAIALHGLDAQAMGTVRNRRRVELQPPGASGQFGDRPRVAIDIDSDDHRCRPD
jgi:hypothetical protein